MEKISGLCIEIDFKSSDGRLLKTKTIYAGKVVPGNEYRFDLSQNGVRVEDVDKTEKLSRRVTVGKTIN